jgi:hypothetical protein
VWDILHLNSSILVHYVLFLERSAERMPPKKRILVLLLLYCINIF